MLRSSCKVFPLLIGVSFSLFLIISANPIAAQQFAQPGFSLEQTAFPQATEKGEIVLRELLGEWETENHETVTIALKDRKKRTLSFEGRHKAWEGTYDAEKGELKFSMIPKLDEMNPAIPSWARNKARGQLKWLLVLKIERIGSKRETLSVGGMRREEIAATGQWFPGEVHCEQSADTTNYN